MHKIFLVSALVRDSVLSPCSFSSLSSSLGSTAVIFPELPCQDFDSWFLSSRKGSEGFSPQLGQDLSPGMSPGQLGCVKPPVHTRANPSKLIFQLLKNGFKYQTRKLRLYKKI